LALGARVAFSAIQVRLHAASVSRFNVVYPFADGNYFDSQFVPGDARVIEERKFSQITADVGSANSHSRGSYKSLSQTRLFGFVDLYGFEFFWRCKL
jgi:hypothetical protein